MSSTTIAGGRGQSQGDTWSSTTSPVVGADVAPSSGLTTDAGARGTAPVASPAVEPPPAPRSGPADPLCSCNRPASDHGALGGMQTTVAVGGQVRQTPSGICGLARWQVHAAQVKRCDAVVHTARFTWSCLRSPHEHHPDDHVMTAVAR